MESVAYITTTFPTLAWFLENEVHRLVRRGVRVRVLTLRPVGREYQPEHAPLAFLTRRIGNLPGAAGLYLPVAAITSARSCLNSTRTAG